MTALIFDTPPYKVTSLLANCLKGSFKDGGIKLEESKGWVQTLCARSALRCILLYLRSNNQLDSRAAQILMPQWTCNAIHQTSHKVCFPTNRPTKGMRGVMVYHQYGFPQDMKEIDARCAEQNLFVIENSVNCFDSYWRKEKGINHDRRVASIFSWSKLFPVILGGAIQTDNTDLCLFFKNQRRHTWKFAESWSVLSRLLFDKSREWYWEKSTLTMLGMASAITDFGCNLPLSTKWSLSHERFNNLKAHRKSNYLRLRNILADTGLLDHLEENVIPYIVPVHAPINTLERIDIRLKEIGLKTGIYHFDMNRNVFEPRFEKTVLIPVHTGLLDADIVRIGEEVRRCL